MEENNNINDKDGWNKYVVGPNQAGTTSKPYANNTYSITQTNDFTTYYLIFNQNRTNYNATALTREEIQIANTALQNTNFRLALIHGLSRSSYDPSYLNDLSSSIIPRNFITDGITDYNDYFLEKFASKNNLPIDYVKENINCDSLVLNQYKSLHYLSLALNELNIPKESRAEEEVLHQRMLRHHRRQNSFYIFPLFQQVLVELFQLIAL